MRYKVVLQYDGARFPTGWQKQPNKSDSVQAVLSCAAEKLFGYTVEFYGSGRTDGGVHALGQVAHFDLQKPHSLKTIHEGLNNYLRNTGCVVMSVSPVKEDFHARFSAKNKTYEYVILHSRSCGVFDDKRVWWIRNSVEVNWDLVASEVKKLEGTHDFSSFRDAKCQSSTPIRTIDNVGFCDYGDKKLIWFKGKSFVHKQIRIMVGSLVDIGRGKLGSIENILASLDRKSAGPTAPACGLYLKEVRYEE